jgi:hypothetical protein
MNRPSFWGFFDKESQGTLTIQYIGEWPKLVKLDGPVYAYGWGARALLPVRVLRLTLTYCAVETWGVLFRNGFRIPSGHSE